MGTYKDVKLVNFESIVKFFHRSYSSQLLSKQAMISRLASPMLVRPGGACVITGRGAIRGHRVEHYRSSECGGFGGGKSGVTSIRGFSSLLPPPPLCPAEKDDLKVWGRPPAPSRLDICHLQAHLIHGGEPAWL